MHFQFLSTDLKVTIYFSSRISYLKQPNAISHTYNGKNGLRHIIIGIMNSLSIQVFSVKSICCIQEILIGKISTLQLVRRCLSKQNKIRFISLKESMIIIRKEKFRQTTRMPKIYFQTIIILHYKEENVLIINFI